MATTRLENEALVRGFLVDVLDGGDTDAVDAYLAADVDVHNPVFGDAPDAATGLGWRVLAAADVDVDVEAVVATDRRAAARATVAGTHRESLVDLAPTGATFEIPHAWFCRIDGGRIAEILSLPDGLGLLAQLDAVPEPTANRATTDPTDNHRP